MKKIIIGVVVVVIIILGFVFFLGSDEAVVNNNQVTEEKPGDTNTKPDDVKPTDKTKTVLGLSAGGNDIVAYHYGEGEKELLFIGGIHGGYAWNSSYLSYELMDYLKTSSSSIPSDVKVTVIPVMNPDGLKKVAGTAEEFALADVSDVQSVLTSGRFNDNLVDLNRNFDCDWQENATWQNKKVSGGTAAFSEPEAKAIKDYVEKNKITAVVTFDSAVGGVFASNCHNGVSTETNDLVKAYSKASGYKAYQDFDFYSTTGDMINWFAKNKIPAIGVLLTTHTSIEWNNNKAGVEAVLKYYSK